MTVQDGGVGALPPCCSRINYSEIMFIITNSDYCMDFI